METEQGLAIPASIKSPEATTPAPQTVAEVMLALMQTAGTLELTEEQRAIVFAPVDPDLVEIRPDGPIYLPAMEYRNILCQAFGLEWRIIPDTPMPLQEGSILLWGFHLIIQGVPMGFAWGEQNYQKGDWRMSYGDAIEGAKSNALMRLCKGLNMCKELWRPSFGRQWKEQYADTCQERDKKGNMKTLWRRKESTTPPAQPEETPDSEKPETKDADFYRRKVFAHAGDLGMTEDEVTALCTAHFFVCDPETGKTVLNPDGSKIPVTEKKTMILSQWRKLTENLYDTWVAAGKPKKEKKKKPAITKSPEKKPAEKQEDPSVLDLMATMEAALGTDLLSMKQYLEFQYIANIDSLSDEQETAIKELLTKVSKDGKLAEQVKASIEQWRIWRDAVAEEGADVDEMVAVLAAQPEEIQSRFLIVMEVHKLKEITPEKFGDWRSALDDLTKSAEETQEQGADAQPPTVDDESDDDLPFC